MFEIDESTVIASFGRGEFWRISQKANKRSTFSKGFHYVVLPNKLANGDDAARCPDSLQMRPDVINIGTGMANLTVTSHKSSLCVSIVILKISVFVPVGASLILALHVKL